MVVFSTLRIGFGGFFIAVVVSACGGGGGSADRQETSVNSVSNMSVSSSLSVSSAISSVPSDVSSHNTNTSSEFASSSATNSITLSGVLTYDSVAPVSGPATQAHGAVYLDYSNIQAKPMRGVTVQLLDSLNGVVDSMASNERGEYSFIIDTNRAIKVRVKAQLESDHYSVTVKDNTQGDAEYVLDGSLVSTGSSHQVRDLHAPLGWSDSLSMYSGERGSAPFALLDTVLDSINVVVEAGDGIILPPLTVYWSTNNIASGGDFSDGQIGSSLYSTGRAAMYILGHADNDTDEFDRAVIQHEFGHYIEDKLSRSESIGGSHFLGVPIDMRVAFGEGFGNAFAGMSSNDPLYLDTSTQGQQNGFGFSVETNRFGGGQYSESAVQAVLFDLFDDTAESGDSLSLGFAPILQALRDPAYTGFDGLTSIYSFAEVLKSVVPDSADKITSLLNAQGIIGAGYYGEGETSNGGASISLPVYHTLGLNGSIEVCSNNNIQEYNGHEVNRYVLVDIPSAGTYSLTALRKSGIQPSDPDFQMYRNGVWAGLSETSTADQEVWTKRYDAGVYALIVQEASNADEKDATGGLVCFDVSLTQ